MSRSKDQWLEQTGGFRFGESPEGFQSRAAEIQKIEADIKGGKIKGIEALEKAQRRLCTLKGIDFDSDDDD